MKIKIADAIRRISDSEMAVIIGSIVAQYIDGISASEAVKLDYPRTLQALQQEIEIDDKHTNADRIRAMGDEELAEFLQKYFTCEYECAAAKEACVCACKGSIIDWLQSEAE